MRMKKFLLSLAAVLAIAFAANAKDVKEAPNPWDGTTVADGVYTFGGNWKGSATWLGSEEKPYDASANDYAYIKVSGVTGGPIRFAVQYNKFVAEQNWGKEFKQEIVLMSEDGLYGIKLDKENLGDGGKTLAEEVMQLVVQDDGKAGSLKIEEIGFCTKAEYDEMSGPAEEPTPGANHVLKLTQDAAKANPWDTQVFINIKNLKEGEKYTIEFDVLGGADFTLGTETIDDAQTEHMTEWNASAVFNYTEEIKVTTSWTKGLINAPGVTDVNCHSHCTPKTEGTAISHASGSTSSCNVAVHENTTYAATAILVNVGKTVGELCIDNVIVKDAEGNVVFTEDFENAKVAADSKSSTAYFPGWQGAKWEIVEKDAPNSLGSIEAAETVAVAYDLFGNAGATKGFMVKGGKKVYVK